jgi:hypothetical protein
MSKLIIICSILFIIVFPLTASNNLSEFRHLGATGEVLVTFDSTKISRDILLKYYDINPYYYNDNFIISRSINYCNDSDPSYLPCGSRQIVDKNFLINAELNLRLIKKTLDSLKTFKEIKELNNIVAWAYESLHLGYCLESTKYEFLKTKNIDVLKCNCTKSSLYDSLFIIINHIKNIPINQINYNDLNTWHNYQNNRGRLNFTKLKELNNIWELFIKKYGIKEELLEEPEP